MARSKSKASGSVYIAPELESNLQDRLSRIEGHVRGVKNMLADHRNCDDVMTQIAGVKAAINQVAVLLLEGHLDTCITEAVRSGNGEGPVEAFKESLSRVLKYS